MKFILKFVLILIAFVIAGFTVHYFNFNIYEVNVDFKPAIIFADPSTEIIVTVKPINALGWNVPLRSVKAKFKVIEGDNLVIIKFINEENGYIILQSKGMEGKVGMSIDSEYSLFPSYIELQILPKTV